MIPAKAFGGKVTQYFIGFGPTVWSRKRGETEYGVKAIPLGGYVKIVGMLPPGAEQLADEVTYDADGNRVTKIRKSNTGLFTQLISDARAAEWELIEPEDERPALLQDAWWKKVVVMAGGPTVNIAIAFFLFWGVFATYGNPSERCPTRAAGDPTRHRLRDPRRPRSRTAPARTATRSAPPRRPARARRRDHQLQRHRGHQLGPAAHADPRQRRRPGRDRLSSATASALTAHHATRPSSCGPTPTTTETLRRGRLPRRHARPPTRHRRAALHDRCRWATPPSRPSRRSITLPERVWGVAKAIVGVAGARPGRAR